MFICVCSKPCCVISSCIKSDYILEVFYKHISHWIAHVDLFTSSGLTSSKPSSVSRRPQRMMMVLVMLVGQATADACDHGAAKRDLNRCASRENYSSEL